MSGKMKRGVLIAVEGSDGSGKATQSRLLVRRLRSAGLAAERMAFPRYAGSLFGRMVAEYLCGELGRVHPRLAALLYAADRWQAKERIIGRLADGAVVVCDRYVDSNKAHQAARLPAGSGHRAFMAWIDKLEYDVFGIPRPDLTIFLHVPYSFARELMRARGRRRYLRGGRRDMHEADETHLRKTERIYLEMYRRRPRTAVIRCVEEGRLLSRAEIAERVWAAVRPCIGRRA